MRQIICLLMLVISSWSAYSQETTDDYRPFVEEGKVWISFQLIGDDQYRGTYIRYDYFDGDTIVCGQPCKRWRQELRWQSTGDLRTIFTVAAYEEDKKVWFYLEGDTVRRLMFDFGAAVGETFTLEPPDGFCWDQTHRLERNGILDPDAHSWDTLIRRNVCVYLKEDIVLFGQKHHVTEINGTDSRGGSNRVLEGVGTLSRPDNIFCLSDDFYNSQLISCLVGDEVLYFNNDAALRYGISIPTIVQSSRVNNHKSGNVRYYDLMGRRLAAPPAKGMYIENGRKVVR